MTGEFSLVQLLPWVAPGIALLGTGIAWGLMRGKQEASERRSDGQDRRMDRMEAAFEERLKDNESMTHETRRHLGVAQQDIRVLFDRAGRVPERKP